MSVTLSTYGGLPLAATRGDGALSGSLFLLGSLLLLIVADLRQLRDSKPEEQRQRGLWATLLFVTLLGIVVCLVGLFGQPTQAEFIIVAACLGLVLGVLVVSLFTDRISLARAVPLALRLRSHPRVRLALKAAGGLALVAVGVLLATLIRHGAGSQPAPVNAVAFSGYRVRGTCVDGACSVNECATDARCGLARKGRLLEGAAVEIVCQTRGGRVDGPGHRHSNIWDRLPSGLFVTDLYVSTRAVGHLTPHLPRCSS